jgi:hypothetical protein
MSRRASSREIAEPGAWVRKKSSSSARGDVCRSELAVLMALFVTMMDPAGPADDTNHTSADPP